MARPPCCRRVARCPGVRAFIPDTPPGREPDAVVMTLDEFEAIRLADLQGLYHEQGALKMGVSRATFSRIVASAHHKVALALTGGKILRIEGGAVRVGGDCPARCRRCPLIRSKSRGCPREVGPRRSSACPDPAGPSKSRTGRTGRPKPRVRHAPR